MNNDFLNYFALKYDGDFYSIYNALVTKEDFTLEEYNEALKNKKYKSITIFSDEYPVYLKKENCPPIVLFYQGNLDLLLEPEIPIKYDILSNKRRYLSTLMPYQKDNGEYEFDYIVCSENQESLTVLLDSLKSSDFPIKNYEQSSEDQMKTFEEDDYEYEETID